MPFPITFNAGRPRVAATKTVFSSTSARADPSKAKVEGSAASSPSSKPAVSEEKSET
jgi:hypothetical protein